MTKIVLSLLILGSLLYADDLDMAFDGFEDEEIVIEETLESQNWYSLSGYLSFLSAYNYNQKSENAAAIGDKVMDFSGFSRAKTKLNIALDMKHSDSWKSRIELMGWYDASWAIQGRSNYTSDVLDSYQSFSDIKDAYLQGTLSGSVDIKLGRQIVIWGKSDSIRITDVINPLDIREPGMVDIKDLRLTETMSKLNYYFDNYALSAMIIHESRLPIEPAFGSDYRPRDVFGTTAPDSIFPDVYQPSWDIKNTQFALSLDGRFEGWDLSLYAANILNSRFSIKPNSSGQNLRNYDKIYMAGIATSIVVGSWLYKAEAAYIADIDYRSVEENKNRLDTLVGIDYAGFSKTTLSFELANRHVFAYEDIMLKNTLNSGVFPDYERENIVQIAIRGNYLFDHDNASVNYLLSMFGSKNLSFEDGGFQRFWLDYKYNDDVSLNAGLVDYIGGNGVVPFYNAIKNNDRVYAEFVYHF
ncbi:DUF1302 family protein [Sulfurimonas sp. MAG313]|nr:DUF1302 family protein [Sulfurimonas sp. MAG313]MDF1881190.1 DUF1302 family protein [Sulfurimonas sp. MAG313]